MSNTLVCDFCEAKPKMRQPLFSQPSIARAKMCLQEKLASPLLKQIWVVSSILSMMVGHGMVIGMSSSMVPELQAPDSPIKIDLEQASWLSASVGIGSTLTYMGSSIFMAAYGRRGATLIGLVPAIIGPLICYFVSDINALIFGRFISGVGMGAIGLVAAVVIGEFTSPEYRGVFLNFKSGALFFGTTIVHILGNYFHWRTVTLIIIVPYIINFGMAYTWPESPAWLAAHKKFDECSEAFYWLRGKSEQSNQELAAMIAAQKKLARDVDKTLLNGIMLYLKKFKQKNFLKPVGIYLFAAIFLEVSGRHVFPAYALQIVKQMDQSTDESRAFHYTLCMDLLITVSAMISVILIKFVKRRTLLFYTGISSVFVLLVVCLYFYLQSISLISQNSSTLPLFLFGLYFILSNTGCTPICLTLIGELFPLEHRPTGAAMAGTLISIFMFLVLKITPVMLATLKVYGTFAIFGITMAICLLVLYCTLPETKDKTLQEIEDYFNDSNFKKDIHKTEEEVKLTDVNNKDMLRIQFPVLF